MQVSKSMGGWNGVLIRNDDVDCLEKGKVFRLLFLPPRNWWRMQGGTYFFKNQTKVLFVDANISKVLVCCLVNPECFTFTIHFTSSFPEVSNGLSLA